MEQRLPLSVSLITLNEEANLPRCLDSVRDLAAEIVVVDSGSTDRTIELARKAGAVFISQPWQGFTSQKNFSLERCSQPWVLCLDADEVVSSELASSIRRAQASKPTASGFWLNRRTYFLGSWIQHAWYPEWRLRLVRREAARWVGADPHPSLQANGDVKQLSGDLHHFSYANLQQYFERTVRYARASADQLERAGIPCRWYHLVFSPWLAFLKKLVLRSAWRDGWRGWIISVATCFGVFAKYAFQLEMELKSQTRSATSSIPSVPNPPSAPARTDSRLS